MNEQTQLSLERRQQLEQVRAQAECLYTSSDIDTVLEQLAQTLTEHYAEANPILLCVMNGSLVTLGQLMPKLPFLCQVDYIHVSRYGEQITGGELIWHHHPVTDLTARHVILVEDIVDRGDTLVALREYCHQAGAESVRCMTLIDKQGVEKKGLSPEFVGLTVPNRYVFGFGMDYQGYWRNLPGIYAVQE